MKREREREKKKKQNRAPVFFLRAFHYLKVAPSISVRTARGWPMTKKKGFFVVVVALFLVALADELRRRLTTSKSDESRRPTLMKTSQKSSFSVIGRSLLKRYPSFNETLIVGQY